MAANAAADDGKLGGSMGFATLRPTFPEASAQLVELMRATLRHAQEITAHVGEAEMAAKSARAHVAAVDANTTQAERRVVESEIEKLSAWLAPPKQPDGNNVADKGNQRSAPAMSVPPSPPAPTPATLTTASGAAPAGAAAVTPSLGSRTNSGLPSAAPVASAESAAGGGEDLTSTGGGTWPLGSSGADAAGHRGNAEIAAAQGAGPTDTLSDGAGAQSIALDMAEEIETTVMWVQQLLESVHFIDSDTALEPGASLLSIVQPGRRHQKDIALHQSKAIFREKKEAEEEDDKLDTAIFRRLRGEALQAVSAQRTAIGSRE